MKEANQKYTILYARLSQEDEREGDSNSIQNQRMMLEKYAADHGFANTKFLYDDGYSGTNFRRPDWLEAMRLVENDEVATVITKDQSRLGRDVLEVGLIKRTFEQHNVRYIAAGDNLDTAQGFDIMSMFRDVFNGWFVADTSKKIRAVVKAKAERGERVGTRAPYG